MYNEKFIAIWQKTPEVYSVDVGYDEGKTLLTTESISFKITLILRGDHEKLFSKVNDVLKELAQLISDDKSNQWKVKELFTIFGYKTFQKQFTEPGVDVLSEGLVTETEVKLLGVIATDNAANFSAAWGNKSNRT